MVTVSISEQAVDHIEDLVESGRFTNANDVIQAALDALEEQLRIAELRAAIAEADEEFERGEYVEWTPGFVKDIAARFVVRSGQQPGS